MTRRLGILIIATTLVIAPAAIASGKHLKLTAVVTGQKSETGSSCGAPMTLYAVKQGSKKVGTLTLDSQCGCPGNMCPTDGIANLGVGKVTGKAYLKTTTTFTGCPDCVPFSPTKFKSNTGKVFKPKQASEAIRVNGVWPITKGSKVTFVLSY